MCPLPSLGCLHAPTFLRQLCVNCLSSCRLHINYTWKTRVPPMPRAPPKSRATCHYPRAASLPSLLVSPTASSTICVDYSFVLTTSPLIDYSLYQHPSEIQCAVQNIFNERVMDRGYLGDVSRCTVMRFGTVDPKRPAVAILAMHPRSLDSSWRG